MTNEQAALETLNEQIRQAELRIARCGDEWLQRVQRQDLSALYRKRKTLIDKMNAAE